MLNSIKKFITRSSLFRLYIEQKIRNSETQRFLAEVVPPSNIELLGNKSFDMLVLDYKKALKKHRVTWSEYFYQYEYWKLSEEKRNSFVSRSNMQKLYRTLVHENVRELMHNKEKFLQTFNSYIYRRWICLSEGDTSKKENLRNLLELGDCIIKPISGSLGSGIRKISMKDIEDIDILYKELCKEKVLVEECLKATDEIQSFNPDSLNTIRVVTISKKPKATVFGAFIRMGRKGAVVDNAHAGGIFAQINVETGIIESCGITTDGKRYEAHPDTQKQILGFKIPQWEEIKKSCLKAALSVDNLYFAGWDICIRTDGKIEFIEGNHAPDFDVMQSPLKIGVKEKLNKITTEYFNYELK
ncbi:MAG: hypothetical protein IKY56_05425 [Alistipes sp.]|nr:hypothetical protein [Alistipes sp.]